MEELFDNELHLAVRVSDTESCSEALKEGYDPNAIGLFEWSAVHEAAHNGDLKILQLLLKYGGDPNKRDYLNGSTALHYAASEGHPECLDILLSNGGDVTVQNDSGVTFAQMARHRKCKDVLSKHGIDIATSVHFEDPAPTKSELRCSSKDSDFIETKHNERSKNPSLPTSVSPKKLTKSCVSDESYESGIGSRTSLSDTASTSSARSSVMKGSIHSSNWERNSSPSKSYSSFGSLTSIGSSVVSGSDDCAGYITMAFQYNSKTSHLKIRIAEIVLVCLLPFQKSKKEATLQLQICSKIYNPNEVAIDTSKLSVKAKSETFRLSPGGDQENPVLEKDGLVQTCWREKDARISFPKSLALEFVNVSKSVVLDKTIQVSICTRSKKNLLSKNSSSSVPFATVDLPLKQATKNLMKETYELQSCHLHGITREKERLDQVLSELIIDSGRGKAASVYSEPHARGRLNESFAMEEIERSVSDGDLKHVSVDTPTPTSPSSSCYDIDEDIASTSLSTVESHTVPASPHTTVKVPANVPRPEKLELHEIRTRKDTTMVIPDQAHDVSDLNHDTKNGDFLRKARRKLKQAASGSARDLHKLVVSRNHSEVESIHSDEERTVGTPPEEIQLVTFHSSHNEDEYTVENSSLTEDKTQAEFRSTRGRSHIRTLSNDSFTKVDESSPSPSRRRKEFKHRNIGGNSAQGIHLPHIHTLDNENSKGVKQSARPHAVSIYGDEAISIETKEESPWYVDN